MSSETASTQVPEQLVLCGWNAYRQMGKARGLETLCAKVCEMQTVENSPLLRRKPAVTQQGRRGVLAALALATVTLPKAANAGV